MAIAVTHLKVSAISDTGDATLVQPSNWNAAHVLTGVSSVAQGGTGFDTYVVGDLLYASAAGALSKLADVAVGSVLVSGGVGVAPTWSATPTLTSLTLGGTLLFTAGNIGDGAGSSPVNIYAEGTITSASYAQLNGLYLGIAAANTVLSTPTDGQLNLTNNAASAGFGIDLATDAVVKFRTRAQTGYSTIDVLGLKASGAAGANFGPAAPASITIVNGIVTACS